jgi:hypothetical protein
MPTGTLPPDATGTDTPTATPPVDANMRVVPVSFSMWVTTHNIFDPVNPQALIQTLADYLTVGIMQAYPEDTAVTATLEGSPNPNNGNRVDYTGLIIVTATTVPSLEDVQAEAQALLLDMAAVQAAVDGNPDISQDPNPTARVEQIVAGNMSVVALSSFTLVVVPVLVDRAQLTDTLEQYLTAGMMEKYPNAVDVILKDTTFNNNGPSSTAVEYSGHVMFSDSTPPSFQDVQAWQQELLLDLTAVQAAVDSNPAIGQDTSVEQVAVDGIGGQAGSSTSAVVALPDFTIVVNTPNDTDPVNQAQLTMTLRDYLLVGIMEEYPNAVAVTLNGSPNQMDPTNAVDYTGHVIFSGTAPPAEDVRALAEELLLDLTAVQAAVDGNPAVGQDAQVEQVTVGGSGGEVGPSTSTVALPDFTIVVNTSDNNGAVDQAQLTMTLQDYLAAGIMEEYSNVVAVILNGTPNQMDPTNAVDYTGHVVFSGTAPPAEDVQALAQELLLDMAALQASVDGNPAMGQDALVEQVTVGGSGGEVGPSTSTVALPNFTFIVTSDDTDTVDESQLTKTLEDYLLAGIMQDYPSAVAVALDGSQTQIDGSNVVDYTGYVVFFDTAPPSAQDVESLVRDLMLNLTNVQAAVDADSGIGQNVRVEQVILGDDSVVALSDFTIVIRSDDINAVNQAELARTLEDYLMAGLMQDFPDVEAVVLQPQQSQQSDTISFSGYAMFAGSAPAFDDVQSRAREVLRDTRAVQTAVDSNPAIGRDIQVVGVGFEGSGDDNDDNKTAKIVGGVVGAGALCLALAAIFTARGRRNPANDADAVDDEATPLASAPHMLPSGGASDSQQQQDANNEESPLASTTPPLPTGVVSKS